MLRARQLLGAAEVEKRMKATKGRRNAARDRWLAVATVSPQLACAAGSRLSGGRGGRQGLVVVGFGLLGMEEAGRGMDGTKRVQYEPLPEPCDPLERCARRPLRRRSLIATSATAFQESGSIPFVEYGA